MIALAIFLLGAATGSVLTWVVLAFRAIGPSRVTREPPRMVVLPPRIRIDMDRPSKALDIARRWKS